jgi:hypothetical protein
VDRPWQGLDNRAEREDLGLRHQLPSFRTVRPSAGPSRHAKAEHLSWEEAAVPTLVGSTAYRMLRGWAGNAVQEGDLVLVWGGPGGLGTQASQLVGAAGGRAIAVVSDDERGGYAMKDGAIGYINRRELSHSDVPPKTPTREPIMWTSRSSLRSGSRQPIQSAKAHPLLGRVGQLELTAGHSETMVAGR